MVGRASARSSGEGSKRRSSVEVSAASLRVGREVMAGRKGAARGLRAAIVLELWSGEGGGDLSSWFVRLNWTAQRGKLKLPIYLGDEGQDWRGWRLISTVQR
jgi:hypothetical protein